MFRFIHRHDRLFLIVAIALAIFQVVPASAQDNPSIEPATPPLDVVSPEAKPTDFVETTVDAKDQAVEGASQLFLPFLSVPAAPVQGAASTGYWYQVLYEGFEGPFPSGLWSLRDYNGSLGGTYVWNDVPHRAYTGGWSAHPKGGWPYTNYMASQMTWGPFSLVGAQKAELRFSFFLISESRYDFLRYGYSCTNGATWTDLSVSGNYVTWRYVVVPLTSCLGASQVKIRFSFDSDTNIYYEGAYVDDILILKYQ